MTAGSSVRLLLRHRALREAGEKRIAPIAELIDQAGPRGVITIRGEVLDQPEESHRQLRIGGVVLHRRRRSRRRGGVVDRDVIGAAAVGDAVSLGLLFPRLTIDGVAERLQQYFVLARLQRQVVA